MRYAPDARSRLRVALLVLLATACSNGETDDDRIDLTGSDVVMQRRFDWTLHATDGSRPREALIRYPVVAIP